MGSIDISIQGDLADRTSWFELAGNVEAGGFERLYVPDHPGTNAAAFPALAAAAAVTERIGLGTYVANAGIWEPVALASAVATLDVVSGGRAVLGLGAGHTPSEWTGAGRSFPSAGERVDRMLEVVDVVGKLLRGEMVTFHGRHVTAVDALVQSPRPIQDPVPLLIGGNGDRVLRSGAELADRVSISGLGRTLADGHHHTVDWSADAIERSCALIGDTARAAGREVRIEALVQHIEITDDAEAAASRLLPVIAGATVDQLLTAPFIWIGTVDEIATRLDRLRETHAITAYAVRSNVLDAAKAVLDEPLLR